MNYLPLDDTWAIQSEKFSAVAEKLRSIDVRAAAPATTSKPRMSYADGGVAVIDLNGILQKTDTILSMFFATTSTADFAAAVSKAAHASAIEAILIRIDSPGGSVRGTSDAADSVFAAGRKKKIVSYISDTAASAAFWIASQADKIYANSTALVGSVGTYQVLLDQSAAAEQMGIRPIVVRAGKFKGLAEPGTPITAEQISEVQRMVDALQAQFTASVARGRKVPAARAEAWATGQIFVGAEAQRMGLVDAIDSFDNVLQKLKSQASPAPAPRSATAPKSAAEDPKRFAWAFSTLVRAQMSDGKCDRQTAIAAVAHVHPELHREFLKATGGVAAQDLD